MKYERTALRACIASVACGALMLSTPLGALAEGLASGNGGGTVYAQSDGYEPYHGWQTMVDASAEGGTGVAYGGHVSWALGSPSTLGAVQSNSDRSGYSYAQGVVSVLTDTAGSTSTCFKNIILPQQIFSDHDGDGDKELVFEFLSLSVGGNELENQMYGADSKGGVVISTSSDLSDTSKIVWTGNAENTNTAMHSQGFKWQNVVTFEVPESDLAGKGDTFYLVLESGMDMGNCFSTASIVFEFSTAQSSTWSGDAGGVSQAGGVSAQGDVVVTGLVGDAAKSLTCDLSKTSYWLNTVTGGLTPDSNGDVSLTMFASASGSNGQTADKWNANTFGVYAENPVENPSSAPVKHNGENGGLALSSTGSAATDGVTFTMSGLTGGNTYYLMVPQGFSLAAANGGSYALQRPVVYRFTVNGSSSSGNAGSGGEGCNADSGETPSDGGGGGTVTPPAEHEHAYGEGVVTTEPTCTAEGVMTYICTQESCTETKTEPIPALGHKFGEWAVTTPATTEAEGVETRTCSICDEAETRSIPKMENGSSEGEEGGQNASQAPVGTSVTSSGITYQVSAKGQVKVTSLSKAAKAKKTVTILGTIKVQGKSYKVVGIKSSLLKGSKATTLVIKTKLLTKKGVKGSLKGSKVATVKVAVSSKKSTNKSYAAMYKKYFTKANCGKAVTVKY